MLNRETDKIKDVLAKDRSIVFAYLFGSRAKGSVSARSDWDIAVYLTDGPEQAMPNKAFYIEADVSVVLGTDAVQVIILNDIDDPVMEFEIIKDSILLLDKDKGKRVDFEAGVLNKYHDWQYFSKRHMGAEGWAYR